MLKLVALAVLSLAAAGGALAQTPAEKLAGGTWVCSSVNNGLTVVSKQSYAAGGSSSVTVMVFGTTEGAQVKIAAEGVGTWSFVGDRLDEQLTRMTATFAEIAGSQELSIAQDLLDDSMVNIPLSNSTSFDGPTLHQVDGDGVITDCVR